MDKYRKPRKNMKMETYFTNPLEQEDLTDVTHMNFQDFDSVLYQRIIKKANLFMG